VVEHGFHLGPRLAGARREAASGPVGGPGGGRRVRSHVRRAHWHTYRTGPARSQTVVHWLPPIAVNPGDSDAERPTIIATASGQEERQ
jgi:hypothetical protein